MSGATASHVAKGRVPNEDDVPTERFYDRREDAALDRQLVHAIEAARNAGNRQLARMLTAQLAAHYDDTR
jgi:hypothetical protein